MGIPEMGLVHIAGILLWSPDGAKCFFKAGDRKICRSLFSLGDILERDDLWSDRWVAPVILSLAGDLESFRCSQEIPGKENSLRLSGLVFHSRGHHGLSFRLCGFQVEEDHPTQYWKYPYFHSHIDNGESARIA